MSDDANLRAGTALVGPAVLGAGLRNVQVAYDIAVDHLIGARSEGWSQNDIKCTYSGCDIKLVRNGKMGYDGLCVM